MISFRNLHKSFGDKRVLRDVSFDIQAGEVFFVIGASGVGKSVLIKHLIGLMRPDSGEIWLDGTEVSRLSETELYPFRKRCAMVFQHATLFDSMTCIENVALPLREHTTLSEKVIDDLAFLKLKMVRLQPDAVNKYPSALSGGMTTRAGVARAMALGPRALFAAREEERADVQIRF